VLKYERIPITTVGEEAIRATTLRPKFGSFYVRQHICYSAYMLSPVRPSVCLSVRQTGGS